MLADPCDVSPVCDSYVRPETLVRICDECNFGTYGGRCIICGSPGACLPLCLIFSPLAWFYSRLYSISTLLYYGAADSPVVQVSPTRTIVPNAPVSRRTATAALRSSISEPAGRTCSMSADGWVRASLASYSFLFLFYVRHSHTAHRVQEGLTYQTRYAVNPSKFCCTESSMSCFPAPDLFASLK